MHLLRLRLQNFRNCQKIEIEPDPHFNVFWGENAQGKTNILEAICLLGTLKSFRNAKNPELIAQGEKFARLASTVEQREIERRIDLGIEERGKRARLDGKEVRNAAEFFGCLNPVLFSPDEIAVARGTPSARRALLDRAIFQADVSYLERVRQYDRHLRQRNALLREEAPWHQIDPWTEGLLDAGTLIRRDRLAYIERLARRFAQAYRAISGGREGGEMRYSEQGGINEELRERLHQELVASAAKERRLKQTLAGPHRDDLHFDIDDRPVRLFASQGQQRSVLLAFKTAQIVDLEERSGESPVLLLDDMTSELDRRRQEYFFNFLLERRGQVFITTTDAQPLMEQGFATARFFKVKNGVVLRD